MASATTDLKNQHTVILSNEEGYRTFTQLGSFSNTLLEYQCNGGEKTRIVVGTIWQYTCMVSLKIFWGVYVMHSRGGLEILHRAQHGRGQKMAVTVWLRSGHWVKLGEAPH